MKKVIILLIIFISFVSFAFSKDEIVFWYAWGGHEGDALLELVDEFNEMQDDLVVRAVYVPIGGGEKIMATLAGNSTPDVVTVWDWMVVPLGYNGALLPLNDLLISTGYDENAYLPNIWNYGVYEDVKYGVPTTLNLYAFMWNKNLFEEFGLDPDNPPADIEQLNEYNDIFFKEDSRGNIRRLGFLPVISHIYFYVFGGGLWNKDTYEITANDPKNAEALQWVADVYQKYDSQKIRVFQASWGDIASKYNPFYKEKLTMQEAGQWEISFIDKFAPEDFSYGVSAFPAPEGGRDNVAYVNGSFWAIPKASKNPEKAFEFLKWLIAPSQSARFSAALFNIPPMKEALEDEAFQKILTPEFDVYLDLLMNGYVYNFPTLPIGQYYLNELTAALEKVQTGKMTAQEALDEVQQKVENELKRYK